MTRADFSRVNICRVHVRASLFCVFSLLINLKNTILTFTVREKLLRRCESIWARLQAQRLSRSCYDAKKLYRISNSVVGLRWNIFIRRFVTIAELFLKPADWFIFTIGIKPQVKAASYQTNLKHFQPEFLLSASCLDRWPEFTSDISSISNFTFFLVR